MEQLLAVLALLVAAGGLLTILVVLGGPLAHQRPVVLHLRSGLQRIDHVLAGWEQEGVRRRASGGIWS